MNGKNKQTSGKNKFDYENQFKTYTPSPYR